MKLKNKYIFNKFIVFLLILCLLFEIADFIFTPANSGSELMWSDYYKTENIDTIYVGSSVCSASFNPYVIDKELGTNSFNMGTAAQSVDLSYRAVKTAIEEHDVERVIFGFGYFTFSTLNSRQAEVAFLQARNQFLPFGDRIISNIEYVTDKENIGESISLNYFLPWVNNHIKLNVSDIRENVNNKIEQIMHGGETELSGYIGKGFCVYNGVGDYDTAGEENTWTVYQPEFFDEPISKMKDIIKLCKENDVEFIVINTPHPTFDIISYGAGYYTTYEVLKAFFAKQGVEYYDFNFAKPELFVSRPEYYYNYEHLNAEGADAFSESFAQFIELRDMGVELDSYFYNWEEYLESVDYEN